MLDLLALDRRVVKILALKFHVV
jgi:hypothetical protein